MNRNRLFLVIGSLMLMLMISAPAFADFSVAINFDENCNGHFSNSAGFNSALPCSMIADPGPGGQSSVMFYNLLNPPGLVTGDVLILDSGNVVSDVLRFDPNIQQASGTGGVFVYSLAGEGSQADIGLPTAFYTNVFTTFEVNGGIVYTPTAGMPGFVTGAGGPVTYTFVSDSQVPEPSSMLLLGSGLAGMIGTIRRKLNR